MRDMDTMFENAKLYNTDESQIYKDAVYLQVFIAIRNRHNLNKANRAIERGS